MSARTAGTSQEMAKPRKRRSRASGGLGRTSMLVAGLMLVTMAILVVVVPFLPSYDPYAQDLANASTGPFSDAAHVLGTDQLGRDLLSRLALAGRLSILIAAGALLINMVVGIVLGMVAGYRGGWVGAIIMGLADLQLSIPILILLIMIVSVVGSSALTLTIVFGLTYWVGYGRVARVVAMSLKEREFVLAAQTYGAGHVRIVRKHILPELTPQLVIMGSFDLGVIIVLESGLSYLGLGIQPPTPSWGRMIAEGQDVIQTLPWLAVAPGIPILLLVGGVQILSQRFTREGNATVSGRENRSV